MLHIDNIAGNRIAYTVAGKLTAADLSHYYQLLREQYRAHGRLRLTVRIHNFAGYAGAVAVLRFLVGEPALLWRVSSYTAVTDDRRFERFIKLIRLPVFWVDWMVRPPTKNGGPPTGSPP